MIDTSFTVNSILLPMTGFLPSATIPLQKQLEHANQQSGFTDSVKPFDFWFQKKKNPLTLKNVMLAEACGARSDNCDRTSTHRGFVIGYVSRVNPTSAHTRMAG